MRHIYVVTAWYCRAKRYIGSHCGDDGRVPLDTRNYTDSTIQRIDYTSSNLPKGHLLRQTTTLAVHVLQCLTGSLAWPDSGRYRLKYKRPVKLAGALMLQQ